MTRIPPPYFDEVRNQSRTRWEQLERDPVLAGPWWQLFKQVQSPRHVLSELLQNADDAGAKKAWASLKDGVFVFEHDGEDFKKEDFESLCRFAYSNKRRMHTIGFRGIGFKSTFSLGSPIEVVTPSLSVRFYDKRFTEPVWVSDARTSDLIRISVVIKDQNIEVELMKNLMEWMHGATPLLFFNSIEELTINGVMLRKRHLGPGPVPGSELVALQGEEEHEVLVVTSPEEPFPEEAISEIRNERGMEEIELPPCRVQLVVQLPDPQRLYVVLPTGVELALPFSCNAPFLQDPARAAIKELSQSPTNCWLLGRLGRLAGEVLLHWLSDESLPPDQRAEAYCLVPTKPAQLPSLAAEATAAIANAFERRLQDRPTLLTSDEHLVEAGRCVAPPQSAYHIWTAAQLAQLFGDDQLPVLHSAVPDDARRRLASWEWLEVLDEQGIINALSSCPRGVPRPENDVALLRLWELVQRNAGTDYRGERRRLMQLVPVEDSTVLLRPTEVIRLPQKKEGLSDEAWHFLTQLPGVIDPHFLRLLEGRDDTDRTVQAAKKLLEDVDLGRPTPADTIADRAYGTLVSRRDVTDEDLVTMAHLLATLDARAPKGFLYIVQDGHRRPAEEGVIGSIDPLAESLLPGDWAAGHLLHPSYFEKNKICRIDEWRKWVESEKSRLLPFVPLGKRREFGRNHARNVVREILMKRGSAQSPSYYQQLKKIELMDFGFPEEINDHWVNLSITDDSIWSKVTEIVLKSPVWYWSKSLQATMKEFNYLNYSRQLGAPFDAEWIADLKGRRSLFDTYGRPCAPAELYLRTPDTEPLQGAEPFVRADLDTEQTRPLLRALGVRESPTDFHSLLDRLLYMAQAPAPAELLGEILKWYAALDKLIARSDASVVAEIRRAFEHEALVLGADGSWLKSGEVFLSGSDEYPESPLVHPAAKSLPMWSRLGIADRPSPQLVLAWLKNLASGVRLDSATRGRVVAALRRYPVQAWQECGHWAALDGTWAPKRRLRYRLGRSNRTNPKDLFPSFLAETADCSMLDPNAGHATLFSDLDDLDAVIEFRLTRRPRASDGEHRRPWVIALGRALARIRLDDEDQTERVRDVAQRLARSVWVTFQANDSPAVTSYVGGAPAGPARSREALWHEHVIFVRDGSVARLFDPLANELAAPFGDVKEVAEAIRACIERTPDFINDYVEQHFRLDPETETPATVEEKPGDWTLGREEGPPGGPDFPEGAPPIQADRGAGLQIGRLAGRGGSSEGEPAPRLVEDARERRHPLFELFETVALSLGYRWDEAQWRFVREDGWWIARAEPPFHWDEYDAAGSRARRYWVSLGDLERSGVEIAAELWGYLKDRPDACVMVLKDQNGDPCTLPGKQLDRLVSERQVAVYPASFRLRKESGK